MFGNTQDAGHNAETPPRPIEMPLGNPDDRSDTRGQSSHSSILASPEHLQPWRPICTGVLEIVGRRTARVSRGIRRSWLNALRDSFVRSRPGEPGVAAMRRTCPHVLRSTTSHSDGPGEPADCLSMNLRRPEADFSPQTEEEPFAKQLDPGIFNTDHGSTRRLTSDPPHDPRPRSSPGSSKKTPE
jgi:hypothetical protein